MYFGKTLKCTGLVVSAGPGRSSPRFPALKSGAPDTHIIVSRVIGGQPCGWKGRFDSREQVTVSFLSRTSLGAKL